MGQSSNQSFPCALKWDEVQVQDLPQDTCDFSWVDLVGLLLPVVLLYQPIFAWWTSHAELLTSLTYPANSNMATVLSTLSCNNLMEVNALPKQTSFLLLNLLNHGGFQSQTEVEG